MDLMYRHDCKCSIRYHESKNGGTDINVTVLLDTMNQRMTVDI